LFTSFGKSPLQILNELSIPKMVMNGVPSYTQDELYEENKRLKA